MKVLYIFLDDTGDRDFRPKKTKYLIWGATAIIDDPYVMYTPLSRLKHELNTHGQDIDRFHAAEDLQWIRDKVFNVLGDPKVPFENNFVVVDKPKAHPPIRDIRVLYPMMTFYLLRYLINRYSDMDRIIIFTDTLPQERGVRQALRKTFKQNIKQLLKNKEFYVYHHSSRSNFGLQAIDYCLWAVFRKWERSDLRSHTLIQNKNIGEFDIFRRGTTVYYQKE